MFDSEISPFHQCPGLQFGPAIWGHFPARCARKEEQSRTSITVLRNVGFRADIRRSLQFVLSLDIASRAVRRSHELARYRSVLPNVQIHQDGLKDHLVSRKPTVIQHGVQTKLNFNENGPIRKAGSSA